MPTLYVENVPEDLHEALRKRARENGTSMAAEVISMLKQWVPTEAELARRRKIFKRIMRIRAQASESPGPFQSAEEMLREDRSR